MILRETVQYRYNSTQSANSSWHGFAPNNRNARCFSSGTLFVSKLSPGVERLTSVVVRARNATNMYDMTFTLTYHDTTCASQLKTSNTYFYGINNQLGMYGRPDFVAVLRRAEPKCVFAHTSPSIVLADLPPTVV